MWLDLDEISERDYFFKFILCEICIIVHNYSTAIFNPLQSVGYYRSCSLSFIFLFSFAVDEVLAKEEKSVHLL